MVAAVTANAVHAVEVKQTEALAQRIVRTWAGMRCRNGLIVEFNDVQLDVLSAAMRCNSKACRFYMVKYLSKDTTHHGERVGAGGCASGSRVRAARHRRRRGGDGGGGRGLVGCAGGAPLGV